MVSFPLLIWLRNISNFSFPFLVWLYGLSLTNDVCEHLSDLVSLLHQLPPVIFVPFKHCKEAVLDYELAKLVGAELVESGGELLCYLLPVLHAGVFPQAVERAGAVFGGGQSAQLPLQATVRHQTDEQITSCTCRARTRPSLLFSPTLLLDMKVSVTWQPRGSDSRAARRGPGRLSRLRTTCSAIQSTLLCSLCRSNHHLDWFVEYEELLQDETAVQVDLLGRLERLPGDQAGHAQGELVRVLLPAQFSTGRV